MRRGSVAWRERMRLAKRIALNNASLFQRLRYKTQDSGGTRSRGHPERSESGAASEGPLAAEGRPQLFLLFLAIGLQPSQLGRELLLQFLDLAVVPAHLRLANLAL